MNARWLRTSIFGAMALTATLVSTEVAQAAPGAAERHEVVKVVYQPRARTHVVYRNGHRVVVRVVTARPHHRYHRTRHYDRVHHRYYYR